MLSRAWELVGQGWFGTLLGAVGIAVGVYLYFRAQKRGLLAWQIGGSRIFGGGQVALVQKDLSVLFRGKPVSGVTLSNIVLWNAGTATINGADVSAKDPLRIRLEKAGQILDVWIGAQTRPVVDMQVTLVSEGVVDVTFDFLDPGDGARIAMVHTAETPRAKMSGTIRGLPNGGCEYLGRM